MNKEKLLKVAELLEQIPPEGQYQGHGFHLDNWRTTRSHNCGTTACAVGHAIMAGITEHLVLKYKDDAAVYGLHGAGALAGVRNGFAAVEVEFGIDMDQALELFSSSRYAKADVDNPAAVAAKIREMIGIPRPQVAEEPVGAVFSFTVREKELA